MIFNLKEEFEKILKPIAGDIKFRLSEASLDLSGMIANEQRIVIEVDFVISGDINVPIQGKKQFPMGEDNHTALIKGVRKFYAKGVMLDIEPGGIGKRFNIDGIKHIYNYTINLVDTPEKGLTEIIVPELKEVEVKKVKKNKFKEVKEYGKNSTDSK